MRDKQDDLVVDVKGEGQAGDIALDVEGEGWAEGA